MELNFESQQAKYKKSYNSKSATDEAKAEAAYNKNVALIKKHNSNPNATYRQSTNDASDYTIEQKLKRNGYVAANHTVKSSKFENRVKGALPNAVDYSRYSIHSTF